LASIGSISDPAMDSQQIWTTGYYHTAQKSEAEYQRSYRLSGVGSTESMTRSTDRVVQTYL